MTSLRVNATARFLSKRRKRRKKKQHFIGVEQCIGNTVVMFQKSKMILMKMCATRVFSSLHFKLACHDFGLFSAVFNVYNVSLSHL